MSESIQPIPQTRQPEAAGPGRRKKAYSPPRLETLGDLRTITLGASGVGGDWSGFNMNESRSTFMPVTPPTPGP